MMNNNPPPPPSYGAMAERPPNYEEIFGESPEIAIEIPRSQNGFSTDSEQIQTFITFLERRLVERGRQKRFCNLMAIVIILSFFLILLCFLSGGNPWTMFHLTLIFVAIAFLLLCVCNCFE